MSKISKHKDNIYNFMTTKSCFANMINEEIIKDFMESDYILYPVTMSFIFSSQIKKRKGKSFHTLHISSAIILMTLMIQIIFHI